MSNNLHLPHSLVSTNDVLGGFSSIANLAWITLQVLRPACFGHVLAVSARCPAKRLHAWLQSRLMSGLMGLSDTPVTASLCFCLFDCGWMSGCLSVAVSLWSEPHTYLSVPPLYVFSLCVCVPSPTAVCTLCAGLSVYLSPTPVNTYQMYFVF